MKLTKRSVDAAKPGTSRRVLWDADVRGFGLRITPNGERTYVLKCRFKGAQRWFTIGKHGSPWTVETARREARRVLDEAVRGIDPAEAKKTDKKAVTVAELCDLYLSEGVAAKKPLTIKADRCRIERHIKPLLGRKRIDVITKGDVERLLTDVAAGKTAEPAPSVRRAGAMVRGGKGVAGQCVTLLQTMLQFAIGQELLTSNPARGVKRPPVRKMQRYLSEAEIGRLALTLDAYEKEGGNGFAAAAIRLLLLSGARRNEIMSLKWREVDLERRCLRLSDSKTREKTIYLNAPALTVLNAISRGDSDYVIEGAGGSHLKGIDKIWYAVRKRAELRDVRLHDLRHSFASVGVAGGLSLPVLGALLGHSQAMTTSRYAHLSADPLRAANDAVGARIAGMMSRGVEIPTNVNADLRVVGRL